MKLKPSNRHPLITNYYSSFTPHHRGAGFTLIELLIVIAVLGVLSIGVFAALDVTSNIKKANLAKAKTFSASVENALVLSQVGKWSFDDSSLCPRPTKTPVGEEIGNLISPLVLHARLVS